MFRTSSRKIYLRFSEGLAIARVEPHADKIHRVIPLNADKPVSRLPALLPHTIKTLIIELAIYIKTYIIFL
jgi:hypothetical protein